MSLGLDQFTEDRDEKVLIVDFGGGTLDISLLHIKGRTIKVLAHDGNPYGGEDIDLDISANYMNNLRKKLEEENKTKKLAKLDTPMVKAEFKEAARFLKERFGKGVNSSSFFVDKFYDDEVEITLEEFKEMIQPRLDEILKPIQRLLAGLPFGTDEIPSVYLVGGSSRMPLVQQLITDFFASSPKTKVRMIKDPE